MNVKKKLLFFLTLFICINLLSQNVTVKAASLPFFTVKAEKQGETMHVTIGMSGAVTNAGGVHLRLSYDNTVFSYTVGSRELLLTSLSESELVRDSVSNGELHFIGNASSGFHVTGDIVSYQFQILDSLAGEQTFKLEVIEFYYADDALSSVRLNEKSATAVVNLADSSVQKVIELIDAIGSVTVESESQVQEAREAYNNLKIQQKRMVTNFDVLTEAEQRLTIIKEQANVTKDEQEADTFRQKHAIVLAKTIDSLALEDEKSIVEALDDWGQQPVNVQAILNPERNQLKRFQTRIAELKKIQEDALYEEELKKEAEQLANVFKERWKEFLSLTAADVKDVHLTGLANALGHADSNALVNSYFMDYIKDEYQHLLDLKEAAANFIQEEDSSAMADKFLSSFGYLLKMKPEDITRAEETDVRAAILIYDMLDDEAKALIDKDAASILTQLLSAIEALPVEDSGSVVGPEGGQIVYKDRVIEKLIEGKEGKALVQVSTQGVNSIIWWLLMFLGITMLLIVFATILLFVVRKKHLKRGGGLC